MAAERTAAEGASAGIGGAAARAFVAVRCRDRSWIVDVPLGESMLAGPRGEALVAVDGITEPLGSQGCIAWNGRTLSLRETARAPEIFLGGKRMESPVELKPGDELTIGPAHLVVGISSPDLPATRRALTHAEFKERLAEEMARAGRGGRPTALVMALARSGEGGVLLGAALDCFRAGDVVASYAHDETEILLPDTTRERALAVVERVLRGVELDGVIVACAVAPKDADHPERLMRAARLALRMQLEERGRVPVSRPPEDDPVLDDPASRRAAERLEVRAHARGPILLTGEPSAGKVAFARRMHRVAGGGPMVVLACARTTDPRALESALDEAAEARGGTLILDEIGELTMDAQARWLPVLRALEPEARLVVTSHRDLRALAERGAFHAELAAYLFARDPIAIPPLRQRPDDVVPLATRFAIEAGARVPVRFSAGGLARLRSYPWPGNVLELRNAMERAVRLAGGGEILAEHLPGDSLAAAQGDGRLREHVDSVERDAIVKALAEANHNQTHAAKRLGLSRRALIYKMEKYGLKPPPGQNRRGGRG
ncbi:helix-turn-helix domain-containing protein [Sandaracinus amylolyticus]|uniref:helix-turn-helix domain-containing protein n=1 Tax=Sandaracinus amylolyticus TaxID=927083 RepID=UPI001F46468F|nr:helix-turn-helix domain-containing protein [Sandaracinus amylolyticus]UJR79013.1 Response regulator of zinc sigma-54-dependent two-component system [Sandaracinus amylolyticus]